jgi:hypothetical protein
MAALALWMSFPTAVCVCPDGAFRLSCRTHEQAAAAETAMDATPDCCRRSHAVERTACCCERAANGSGVANKGCTRITNPTVAAPIPASTHARGNGDVVHGLVAIEPFPPAAALAAAQPATMDTGPPVDLVISLHCLLI